jgi:hypothetical protein
MRRSAAALRLQVPTRTIVSRATRFPARRATDASPVDGLQVPPCSGDIAELAERDRVGVGLGQPSAKEILDTSVQVERDLVVDRALHSALAEVNAQGASDAVEASHRVSPELLRGTWGWTLGMSTARSCCLLFVLSPTI